MALAKVHYFMKIKFIATLLLTGLFVGFFALAPIQKAKAEIEGPLRITNIVVTASTIRIDYRDSLCPIGKPSLLLTNSDNMLITKTNPPESADTPLMATLIQKVASKCSVKVKKSYAATISFPNEFSVTTVTPRILGVSNREVDDVSKSTSSQELRFVGITQINSSFSLSYNETKFQLEEFWYQPGKELVRKVLGSKNINAILGTTRDGVIVKTYSKSDKILTWLVTTKKWELLSNKTIYIEPGTLSKNKEWLIGRKVADGPSTRIYAQNLATGSISILFDVANNGGGFVCGGMADDDQKFGYFSHIVGVKAKLYRIDLNTRKVTALGGVYPGFCVSDVAEDGQIVGVALNSKNEINHVVLANRKIPDNALSRQTPSFKSIGQGSSYAYATDSYILIQDQFTSSLYISSLLKLEPWEGPLKLPTYVQFINPLPTSWQETSERATQS
jgi:hypothetical protein